MRTMLLTMLIALFTHSVAKGDIRGTSEDTGHWVALNEEYLLEIVDSHLETLTPQEWDSQMIIKAKLDKLPRVVKALRFLVSQKSASTLKAMKILGYTDTSASRLRTLVAEHLANFARVKAELEAALRPEEDDSDLEE